MAHQRWAYCRTRAQNSHRWSAPKESIGDGFGKFKDITCCLARFISLKAEEGLFRVGRGAFMTLPYELIFVSTFVSWIAIIRLSRFLVTPSGNTGTDASNR